jgi:hypothetical protein
VITRYIELSCDHEDCSSACAASPQELTSLQLTRVGSMVHGWTRHDGSDYCPDHRREELADAIRKLAGQRLTDGQIGKRLGLGLTRVQRIRAEHGIAPGLGRVGRPSKVGGAR